MTFGFIPPEIWGYISLAFHYAYLAMPIWLPAFFLSLLVKAWVDYRRAAYWQGMGTVMLEIKLPKEISKSPLAMELVLNTLHQTADEGNWYWKYWKGQTRSWFSLELISEGGNIRFFIWSRKKYKNQIEVHLYSQYPGIEVYEVEDYTKDFVYSPDKYKMFATEWKLSQPDPYPIKTYVDYGLDKDPDEEFKVDPFATLLEFLGSLPAGHTLWFQIIIRAHKKEQRKSLTFKEKWEKLAWSEDTDAWKDEAKAEIKKILDALKVAKEEGGFPRIPTKGEAEKIAALERSVSKIPFDVGIRSLYIAEKEKYSGSFLGGMLGAFKQFGSPELNGFGSTGWSNSWSYPWQSWFVDKEALNYRVIEEYKLRRYFFSPWRHKYYYSKPMVLNAEELATIYHFPGLTAATPTLQRVPSKKSEAPSNLPI